jgi:beta-lactamase superfamily II metal-dependent hydrolase
MSYLKLTFLDVQHGSACHIQMPSSQHILFDLGTGDFDSSQDGNNHSPIKYLQATFGVTQADGVVVTHPHADHIADIENFHLISPRVFWRPVHITEEAIRGGNRPGDSAKIDRYLEISKTYTGAVIPTTDPFSASVNGCSEFEIWGVRNCAQTNLNNQSLAATLSYAGTKFLLTGDQEKDAWDELFQNTAFVKAIQGTHILLASHHGRESGYYEPLFAQIKPCLTIISDGPQGNTCVADKYRTKTGGWDVFSRKTKAQASRQVLTTRNDGTIQVTCTSGSRHVTIK